MVQEDFSRAGEPQLVVQGPKVVAEAVPRRQVFLVTVKLQVALAVMELQYTLLDQEVILVPVYKIH